MPSLRIALAALVVALLPAFALAKPPPKGSAPEVDHAPFTQLLQRHVKDGVVDYPALGKERAALTAYLERLRAVDEKTLQAQPRPAQLAYYLNLYNAETLALLLEHPGVKSIRDIGGESGPWKLPRVQLFGKARTLDELEHEIIRKRYPDARVHFALVCAAKGCPKLRSEAYTAAKLEAQLDDQARGFLRATVRFDDATRTLTLSRLFEWFQGDFTRDAGTVPAYVARYVEPALAKRITAGEVKVAYFEYDWALNGPAPISHPKG